MNASFLFITVLMALVTKSELVYSEDSSPGVTKTEITLGQSAAFKGPSAALGTEFWRGAQLYFNKINANGGIKGRKIKVISLDDGYDADRALANTFKLINEHKVFALFNYVGTPTLVKALPAVQLNSKSGLFLFGNFTGAQPQRELPHSAYVYNVRASYREETAAQVDALVKLGYKRFGLFIQDDAYGKSGADGVERALKKHNLEKVAETSYQRGTISSASMKIQVDLLLNAKAEVIIIVGAYAASAAAIRDLRDANFTGPITNLSFVGPEALQSELEKFSTKDKNYADKLINSQVVPSYEATDIKIVNEYLSDIKQFNSNLSKELPNELKDEKYQMKTVSFGSFEGYINAKIFIEALKKTKEPLSRATFTEAATHLKMLDIGLNNKLISFSKENNQAIHDVFLTTIIDRKYKLIKNWKNFAP